MLPLLDEIRVVLADDHLLVREGVRALLEAERDIVVVAEAGDGEAAWRSACTLRPDIVVLDLSMPVMGGVQAAERIRRDCPGVRVLALTVHEEEGYLTQFLRAGADGYVVKRSASKALVDAIRALASGQKYFDAPIREALVAGYLGPKGGAAGEAPEVLSVRERDVLVRIAQGFSNKAIAEALAISVKTVETYKARIAEKLGLRSRVDIVRYAAHHGWLDVA